MFKRLSSKTASKVGVQGRRFMPRKPVYSGERHEYALCNAVHMWASGGIQFVSQGPTVNRIVE